MEKARSSTVFVHTTIVQGNFPLEAWDRLFIEYKVPFLASTIMVIISAGVQITQCSHSHKHWYNVTTIMLYIG